VDSLSLSSRRGGALKTSFSSGMPPEQPADMPVQSLCCAAEHVRQHTPSLAIRRWWVLGGAVLLSLWGINEMYSVLSFAGLTFIEYIVLALFSLTFSWITVAFTGAIAGFLTVWKRASSSHVRQMPASVARTAVLMPTYNESPERVFAAIETMSCAVLGTGQGQAFDWFILSDTTDPQIAVAEEVAFATLRERLADQPISVYYRRRNRNVARKAGNVADFCRRWGGGYEYLLVLDADSLMEASTMLELVRRMQADPDAGLIQTIPRLINGTTIMARLQQFATRVYGPVVGTGLSWWTQNEGNFWGHNAIIRTQAFMQSAGLPDLKGKPPFGGHILSHDFVEAALLRRAGWKVLIADDLEGSYEECPPSIVDLAIRDRRWCQGNLQHSRVLPTNGLHWISRIHLMTGIMSYLSSPLWLLLILSGLVLALQAQFIRPEYFSGEFSLFPSWPRMDAAKALNLFIFTMLILFTPKILGLIAFIRHSAACQAVGGISRLFISFVVEVVLSALVAPVMMLIHSGAVLSIFLGRDAGWNPQRREDGSLPIRELIYRHRWHMIMGVFLTIAAGLNSTALLAWLSPAIAGMLLSVPLSMVTSDQKIGERLKQLGILRTPEEVSQPDVQRAMLPIRAEYDVLIARSPSLRDFLKEPRWQVLHCNLMDVPTVLRKGEVDALEVVAREKLSQAETLTDALQYLTQPELARVVSNRQLFIQLSQLPEELCENVHHAFAQPESANVG